MKGAWWGYVLKKTISRVSSCYTEQNVRMNIMVCRSRRMATRALSFNRSKGIGGKMGLGFAIPIFHPQFLTSDRPVSLRPCIYNMADPVILSPHPICLLIQHTAGVTYPIHSFLSSGLSHPSVYFLDFSLCLWTRKELFAKSFAR